MRGAVQEALEKRRAADLLELGGIIGGEEQRTMPSLGTGCGGSPFSCTTCCSYLAVSVIALYKSLIAQLTAFAVVLPWWRT